jgi:hypothetical protein
MHTFFSILGMQGNTIADANIAHVWRPFDNITRIPHLTRLLEAGPDKGHAHPPPPMVLF